MINLARPTPKLSILPWPHLTSEMEELICAQRKTTEYLEPFANRRFFFLPSGKAAISLLLSRIHLTDADEIFLTSSTGGRYISSCVTCTIFNHCKPSRMLGANTRAIFIIHEHGIPHRSILALRAEADSRDIPLIEDCAHSYGVTCHGRQTGSFGDFSIYSLPKVFPVQSGGILSVSADIAEKYQMNTIYEDRQTQETFHHYGPLFSFLKERRMENYHFLCQQLGDLLTIRPLDPEAIPYFFASRHPAAGRIKRHLHHIEWGAALDEHLLLHPIHCLISLPDLARSAHLFRHELQGNTN